MFRLLLRLAALAGARRAAVAGPWAPAPATVAGHPAGYAAAHPAGTIPWPAGQAVPGTAAPSGETPGRAAPAWPGSGAAAPGQPARAAGERPAGPVAPGGFRGGRPPRRRRIPLAVKWGVAVLAAALIFRRALVWITLAALSATLHVVGLNVHLPQVRFGWPWQGATATATRNTDLGPWVLQKIKGISRPALGQASFSFVFTHKVSKSLGIWPCWYASTFYTVGHASATVDLNPGPSWWAPGTGHYRLRVLRAPQGGHPGRVAVTMTLPAPALPTSVHDIVIDNLPSRPLSTQHSWTYPGLGCGVLIRPQFPQSVLYAQAQQIAFYKATHSPQITRPLVAAAESTAARTIRDNFIQPTVNAFGYTLQQFTLDWAPGR